MEASYCIKNKIVTLRIPEHSFTYIENKMDDLVGNDDTEDRETFFDNFWNIWDEGMEAIQSAQTNRQPVLSHIEGRDCRVSYTYHRCPISSPF